MNREQNHKLALLLILSAHNSLIHTPLWVSWTLKSLLSLTGQLQWSHVSIPFSNTAGIIATSLPHLHVKCYFFGVLMNFLFQEHYCSD